MDNDLFTLEQNYPNPFTESTTIKFNLLETEEVTLTIRNMYGVVVQVLVSEMLPSGNHQYRWEASQVASGTYFYMLRAGSQVLVKKMVIY